MKTRAIARYSIMIALLLAGVLFTSGCARFPEGTSTRTIREMSFQITFNGPINDNDYYFIPIDINGDGDGPRPVFPDPTTVTGTEWLTGSATHYVEYHAHTYTVYRIDSIHPFSSTQIGTPAKFTLPQVNGTVLSFTLDLDALGATSDSIDFNIICLNELIPGNRFLDGLGTHGDDFANVVITGNRTIRNSDGATPEGPNDVLDQNMVPQSENDITSPIDITDWLVTITV